MRWRALAARARATPSTPCTSSLSPPSTLLNFACALLVPARAAPPRALPPMHWRGCGSCSPLSSPALKPTSPLTLSLSLLLAFAPYSFALISRRCEFAHKLGGDAYAGPCRPGLLALPGRCRCRRSPPPSHCIVHARSARQQGQHQPETARAQPQQRPRRGRAGWCAMAWRSALSKNLQELRCAWGACSGRGTPLPFAQCGGNNPRPACPHPPCVPSRILLCQTGKGSEGAR